MATKLFRCLNCAKDFEAEKPACAGCGVDPAADPRDADLIVPLVPTHFDPPSKRVGRGRGHAACDPKLRVGAPRCAFTGEPVAVNCAACQKTEEFIAADGFSSGPVDMKTNKGD